MEDESAGYIAHEMLLHVTVNIGNHSDATMLQSFFYYLLLSFLAHSHCCIEHRVSRVY